MTFTGGYKLRAIPHLRTGLNNRYDSSEILDTDLADCENIEVDTRVIMNAAGYVDYGGATGPFWGGFHAKFEDGTNVLIRQRGSLLEYDDGSGSWMACTLPTEGSPSQTVNISQIPCSFTMLNDIVLWSNGTDEILSSPDGITWTERASLPKSKVLFNNGLNRILFMAQPAAPSRVDWSDINDPLTVGVASYEFIGKNDGAEIIDATLLPTGGMILFKTDRFYQISDITSGIIAVDPLGFAPCVRYTAVSTENSAMWAGPNGSIYEFAGGTAFKVNNNITNLDITNSEVMRGVYFNKKYRLAVPEDTDDYNSIEYVIDRRIQTGVPEQPYTITKNNRYVGCYIREDREVGGIRRERIYFGDGRTVAVGSPAEVPSTFAFINESHDQSVTQGLNGEAQTCSFTTKFFTEDVPFFTKRYVKYFVMATSSSTITVTLGYRTDPFISFTEVTFDISGEDLEWDYEDGNSGNFSEGFAFSYESVNRIFEDIEKDSVDIKGIQFKLSWSSVNNLKILDQAYRFHLKSNFR